MVSKRVCHSGRKVFFNAVGAQYIKYIFSTVFVFFDLYLRISYFLCSQENKKQKSAQLQNSGQGFQLIWSDLDVHDAI